MSGKLDKAVVLYMDERELTARGAKCGTCALVIKDSANCAILRDPRVSLEQGVCGLYVGGEATQVVQIAHLSKLTVGYTEEKGVPTHCGNCEYYGGGANGRGPCAIVEGLVAYFGCCNAWENK